MPVIGVMSSIPYEPSFKKALEPNVNVPGVSFYPHPQDDATNLDQAVKNLLAAGVNYMVTLGGYAAYDAAANNSSVPFFSLCGEVPSKPPKLCWGGISLESWGYNEERVKYLINTKNFNGKGAISLYYNQNSSIASDEIDNWTKTLYPKYKNSNSENILVQTPIPAMKTKISDENDFDTTVDNIQSGAAIVSADPFFHKKHVPLVKKINTKKNLYVCYPLQNYRDVNPNKGSATLYGPSLDDAITALAGVITSAINSLKVQPFSKQPLGNPVPVV